MIYALIGRSGSGKSTLQNMISEHLNIPKVILTTTRPMRQGERQDIDYHFISQEEFELRLEQNRFVETTAYNSWYYGTDIQNIPNNNNCIVVANPLGYYQMLNKLKENNVTGIVIHSDDKMRMLNALNREKHPDVRELCRRFLSDENTYSEIEHDHKVWHVENIFNNIKFAESQIELIIKMTKELH